MAWKTSRIKQLSKNIKLKFFEGHVLSEPVTRPGLINLSQ